LSGIAVGR